MKRVLKLQHMLMFAFLSVFVISCDKNSDSDSEMPQKTTLNIVETAQAEASLSSLVGALGQADAGLVETLSGDGPFTVFAPTNDAFAALLNALGDNYNSLADFDTQAEKDLLRDILLYHVIPSKVMSTDLMASSVPTAFAGNDIQVIASASGFVLGDASDVNANIILADIEPSNGVVHLIDKVLLPQSAIDFVMSLGEEEVPNIVGLAQSVDDLSLLVEALIQADAGLVDVLSGTGPFTVFAPTNAAFAALLDALGDNYNSLADFDTDEEKALLAKVLTYHVVGAQALSTDLSNGQMIATVQGEEVSVNLEGGVFIKDKQGEDSAAAQVIMADVMASNGVVHVIDKVLLPQEVLDLLNPPMPNIVGLAQSVDDLSLLVAALVQADAGLVEVLSGDGPFTVFAPTNAAFADLLETLGEGYNSLADFDTDEEKQILASILTYHVVSGQALSTDLTDHQMITTVQGEEVTVSLEGGVSIIDKTHTGGNVIMADVMASNGVVHVIDRVLLPQEALTALGH
ncbi:MAG: fasciclin domain-containing protein [Flavobacteriaceae bacterium]